MLVLSRKVGETIVIGTGDRRITIKVVNVGANKVRLAIEAPDDVRIGYVGDEVHPTIVRPKDGRLR